MLIQSITILTYEMVFSGTDVLPEEDVPESSSSTSSFIFQSFSAHQHDALLV